MKESCDRSVVSSEGEPVEEAALAGRGRVWLARVAERYGALVLVLLALLLLLPGTADIPLIDRDEPRFVGATRHMIETGDWVVPHFNGRYRFDKPILTYWVMAPGLWMAERLQWFSPELGSRLHSVFSTVLLALTVFWMGRKWYGPLCGFLAAAGLLSCVQIIMHGRSSVADMPMVLCVVLAQWALYELLHDEGAGKRERRGWFWMLYLALGFGFLAKGPVAWLIPLLTALLYRWPLRRKPLPWRNLRLLPGVVIVLVVVGAWGIPALVQTRGLFWDHGMGEHVIERGFNQMAGLGHFYFYYVFSALVSLFPWIAFAGFVVLHLRANWTDKNRFLVAWMITTYVFFSFYSTQLPHYVMPAFAGMFLMFGQLAESGGRPGRGARVFFRGVIGLGGGVGLLLILFGGWAPMQPSFAGFRPLIMAAGAGVGALAVAGVMLRAGRVMALLAALVVAAVSLQVVGRAFREMSVTVRLPEVIGELPAEAEVVASRFTEPGIVFYMQRLVTKVGGEPGELAEHMSRPGARAVILLDHEKPIDYYFRSIWRDRFGREIRMRERDYVAENDALPAEGYRAYHLEGVNPARTSWVRVRVYVRAGE